jgi:hypothetical protein
MIHGHTCQKINRGLWESYHSSKAQIKGMHVLHFETMFSINNHEPKLGHFHWTYVQVLERTKPLL